MHKEESKHFQGDAWLESLRGPWCGHAAKIWHVQAGCSQSLPSICFSYSCTLGSLTLVSRELINPQKGHKRDIAMWRHSRRCRIWDELSQTHRSSAKSLVVNNLLGEIVQSVLFRNLGAPFSVLNPIKSNSGSEQWSMFFKWICLCSESFII